MRRTGMTHEEICAQYCSSVDPELVFTTSKIAKILHVKTNTIIKYPIEPLFQYRKENYYNIRDIITHVFREERQTALDLNFERAKLVNTQNKKAQIELGKLKRDLIPAKEVERVWTNFALFCRQKFLSIPVRSADELVMATEKSEVISTLKKYISDSLNELKEFDLSHFIPDESTPTLDQDVEDLAKTETS